jgi:hypothetical protein
VSTVEIDYVEERGPGIPELPADVRFGAQAAPDGVPDPEVLAPAWEQEVVEQLLTGFGAGLHMAFGKAEKDLLMTQADLKRIGAPMTRILNRYEPTAALSPYADPLLVAHGFALWGWRAALERQRARLVEPEEEPSRASYARPGDAPDLDVDLDADENEEGDALTGEVLAPDPMFPQSVRPRSPRR